MPRRILTALTALLAAATLTFTPAQAAVILDEGFAGDNAALTASGWYLANHSNPVGAYTEGWFQSSSFFGPQTGPGADDYILAHWESTGATGTISDWLITPPLPLNQLQSFSFWTRKVSTDTYPDRLEVRMAVTDSTNVGTTESDVGDFTTVLLTINPTLVTGVYPTTWTQYTINSFPGATGTGRIAFRYYITNAGTSGANGDAIGIDTVQAVSSATVVLAPLSLLGGAFNTPYSQGVTANGGTAPYTYAVTTGSLPSGLSLNAGTGAITGTPTAAGSATFTITATDSTAGTPVSGSGSYTIIIVPPTLDMTPRLPDGTIGTAYSQSVTASGGTAPYSYAVTGGSLPSGLSLDGSSGAITGTPDVLGSATFTITATDSTPGTAATVSVSYTIDIGLYGVAGHEVPDLIYYRFENAGGATVTNDASTPVGSNPASIIGQTVGSSGQFGSALIGNGGAADANYVDTGWATNLPATGWTISCWINNLPATGSANRYLFGDSTAGNLRALLGTAFAGDGNIILRGPFADVLITGALNAQPAVVTFVYDPAGPEIRGYLNGVLNNTVAQSPLSITGAGPFKVGAYSSSSAYVGLPSGGLLDEFRVYGRALTDQEIADTWGITLPTPPTANAESYATPFNTTLAVAAPGILHNDTTATGTLTAALVTGPAHGSLTLNADGSFSYTPAGFSGSDSFTYKANDGFSDSSTVAVAINVGVPAAPVAATDSYSTGFNTPLNVAAPGVLANDTTASGVLTAILVAGPSHGSLTLSANGAFTYTPAGGFTGSDGFTYKANDGFSDSNTVEVTINVSAVAAPVAAADSYSTGFNTPLNVTAPGVLANDATSGSALAAVLVAGPSHGSLTLSANGAFIYTPTSGFTGSDGFTYKANDGASDSNTVAVTINVSAVAAPVAAADSYSTGFNTPLNVAAPGILANDTTSGGALAAVLVTGPGHGTLTLNADGSFSYTPTSGFTGSDGFTYKVNDGASDSNTVAVTINVSAVAAPVAAADSYSTGFNTPLNVPAPGVLANDTTSGGALAAVLVTSPGHGTLTLNADGSFSYTPTSGFSGSDGFSYKANDGVNDSNIVTVSVTVSPAPAIPTLSAWGLMIVSALLLLGTFISRSRRA